MTPTSLQKIVDGEMTQAMLAIALRDLDSDQANWRKLALALLEEQQWAKQIEQMKNARQETISKALVSGEASRSGTGSKASVQRFASVAGSSGMGSARSAFFGALAASLILGIGFAGGYMMFDRQAPSGSEVNSMTSAILKPSSSSKLKWRSFDDGMKMVVTGPNDEKAEIPIYDLGEIDPTEMWAKEDFELAQLNEKLRRKGYQLEVRPEYYTSELNDGRQLVVPVKNVGLKPYGL